MAALVLSDRTKAALIDCINGQNADGEPPPLHVLLAAIGCAGAERVLSDPSDWNRENASVALQLQEMRANCVAPPRDWVDVDGINFLTAYFAVGRIGAPHHEYGLGFELPHTVCCALRR